MQELSFFCVPSVIMRNNNAEYMQATNIIFKLMSCKMSLHHPLSILQ